MVKRRGGRSRPDIRLFINEFAPESPKPQTVETQITRRRVGGRRMKSSTASPAGAVCIRATLVSYRVQRNAGLEAPLSFRIPPQASEFRPKAARLNWPHFRSNA